MVYVQKIQYTFGVMLVVLHIGSAFLSRRSSGPGPTIRPPLFSTTVGKNEIDILMMHDLQAELDTEQLTLCHGLLHASGVRELKDIINLTEEQMMDMGIDTFDMRNILRVKDKLLLNTNADGSATTSYRELSTQRYGAFDRKILSRFEVEETHDFDMQVICSENEVYKGQLFSIEQCEQLNRMSEHYAYSQIGSINAGWSDQIYTLTAQHMACKSVPGMVPSTQIVMRQLFQELYALFPEIVQGSICFENDGEPHLVKYNGKAKGTASHTDNSEYKYITVNAVLSAQDEYTGGGTHITVLDETIRLQQGEMLIHLGDLEHSGKDIKGGVRRLFIAFLACEWKNDELNQPILENARDYQGS